MKYYILFIVFITASKLTRSQDSFVNYPSGQNIEIIVKSEVNISNAKFSYNYLILCQSTSIQKVSDFYVQIKASINSVKNPNNWTSGLSHIWDDILMWSAKDSKNCVLPGESLEGLSFISYGLPSIQCYYGVGFFEIPSVNEGEAPDESEIIGGGILENSVKGRMIGPKYTPNPFIPNEFIDTILSYNTQSHTLGWIKDSPTYNKYNTYLSNAKTALEQNAIYTARVNLQKVLTDVDIDSSTTLTSEAYALLKFNTEYLLEQLPIMNIEDLFEDLLQTIKKCYEDKTIDNQGIFNSLSKKVINARKNYEKEKVKTANNQLKALLNQLEAQNGKHISNESYIILKEKGEFLIKRINETVD